MSQFTIFIRIFAARSINTNNYKQHEKTISFDTFRVVDNS